MQQHSTMLKTLVFTLAVTISLLMHTALAGGESKREIEARDAARAKSMRFEEIVAQRLAQQQAWKQMYQPFDNPNLVEYTNRPNKSIPDNNPVGIRDTIAIPASTVGLITVRIDTLTHTFVGDLRLVLRSPAGDSCVLINLRGGSGDNFIGTSLVDTASRAIGSVVSTNAPFTGYWRPDSALTRYLGSQPAGNWVLFVADYAGLDTGKLVRWTISIGADDVVRPNITHTALTNTPSTGNRVAAAGISDASGLATGAGAPRLWHRVSTASTYSDVTRDSVSGSTNYFTIPGRPIGSIVQYYFGAQDASPQNNIATLPAGGSGINPPGSTAPPTVFSYLVQNPLAGGTYTVGTGGNFPSIDSVGNKLTLDGIAGPVVFNFIDTSYAAQGSLMIGVIEAEQTFGPSGEPIALPSRYRDVAEVASVIPAYTLNGPIVGASATNRITFRPAAGRNVKITGVGVHLIRLLNASWITIDGIGTGGTSLTMENTSPTTGGVMILEGNADNNILRNFTMRSSPGSTSLVMTAVPASLAAPDSNLVENMFFGRGFNGIFMVGAGTATVMGNGNRIMNNRIGAPGDSVQQAGIVVQYGVGTIVSGNTIRTIRRSVAGSVIALTAQTKHLGTRIWNNIVYDLGTRGTTAAVVYGINSGGATGDTTRTRIYNNMVYGLDYTSTATTGTLVGISAGVGIRDTIAYNSVSLTGADPTGIINAGLAITSTSTSIAGLVWRNNISNVTKTTTGAGRSLAFYSANATAGIFSSNYNDLFAATQAGTHVGAITTTNYTTLANWQTGSGGDANSISVAPNFRSPDLHIDSTIATPINGGATPIAGIATDYDGQTRNATTPDIGADEFSPFTTPAATEQFKDHVTSAFRASVTNEGTIGSLNAFVGTGPGSGFQFNPLGTQRLFEGAMLVGLDSVRVSDGARNNANPEAFDADFKFLSAIDSATTGVRTTMTTSFTDSLAETPFGARINQRTISWDTTGLNNFLIFEIDITNTSATPWTTLHAGGFFDWDVNPANAQDRGSVVVDSTNTIPGVNSGNPFAFDMLELHQGASPNSWMGIVPLHENRFRGRRIAISSTEVYPPRMTNGDKWRYMISNRATNPNGDAGANVDQAQVFGVGPYSVAAGATKRGGFAMFGGTSLANAVAAARAAQRAWVQRLGNTINVVLVSVPDPTAGIPLVFALDQNYPNPFNPSTTIRYALPEAAHVNLSIYNVLGQRVAELTNEVQSAGFYDARWNGRNDAGAQVASGVYFYRIEALSVNGGSSFNSLKKALLLK